MLSIDPKFKIIDMPNAKYNIEYIITESRIYN